MDGGCSVTSTFFAFAGCCEYPFSSVEVGTPPISVGGAENVRDSRGSNAKFNFLSIRLRIMCDLWTVKHLQVRKQIRKCTTTTSHFSKWISHIRNYIRWSRAAATRDWVCRSLATPSRLASDPLTIHSSSSSSRFVAEQSTNSTQFNSLKAPLLLHIATIPATPTSTLAPLIHLYVVPNLIIIIHRDTFFSNP